jgi:transposase
MARGRPPQGSGLVDKIDADDAVRERLRIIIDTLDGSLPTQEAAERLGVSESGFCKLRRRALEGMAAGIAPKPVGRPPKAPEETPREAELEAENDHLRAELEAARIRAELALIMPDALHTPRARKKGAKGRLPNR